MVKTRLHEKHFYSGTVLNTSIKNLYDNSKASGCFFAKNSISYLLTQLINKPSKSVMVGSGRVEPGRYITDISSTYENYVFPWTMCLKSTLSVICAVVSSHM